MIALKIIGITPEALSFNGIHCLLPPIISCSKSPEVVRRAYCTGISSNCHCQTHATITKSQIIISITKHHRCCS
jgi:hypothetical protein